MNAFQIKLEAMVDKLRTEIVSGMRKPGSFLPAESQLAKDFQMSNKSVRKGLDILVEEGLIVKIDRVGSVVAESKAQKITLNFGCSYSMNNDILLDELLAEFTRLHPSIHIKKVSLDIHHYVKSIKEMSANDMLDVVCLNSAMLQEMAESGMLSLLEPVETNVELYPIANEAFRYDNHMYASPISLSPVLLCYNRQHFAEAGLQEPDSYWTWDDVIAAGRSLAEYRNKHGFYFQVLSRNRYPVFLLQAGIQVLKDGEERAGSREMLVDSIRTFCRMIGDQDIFPKYFAASNEETNQLFIRGDVSMILSTYYNLNQFNELPLDYDIAPLPTFRRGDPQKSLLVTFGTAIMKNSRSKEAGRQLLRFLSSPHAQRMIHERTVSIPAFKSIADKPVANGLNRPSRYMMYRELFPTYAYHRDLGVSIQTLKAVEQKIKYYWSGVLDERQFQDSVADLLLSKDMKL